MVNEIALRKLVPIVRDLAAQQRFNMGGWASGDVNPHAASYQECGTQFCLAGAYAASNGWRPQYEIVDDVPIATGFFVSEQDRHYTGHDRTIAAEAETIATNGLDLNGEQRHFLFWATQISDVEVMVRRIMWVAKNPDKGVEEFYVETGEY